MSKPRTLWKSVKKAEDKILSCSRLRIAYDGENDPKIFGIKWGRLSYNVRTYILTKFSDQLCRRAIINPMLAYILNNSKFLHPEITELSRIHMVTVNLNSGVLFVSRGDKGSWGELRFNYNIMMVKQNNIWYDINRVLFGELQIKLKVYQEKCLAKGITKLFETLVICGLGIQPVADFERILNFEI